MEKNAQSDNQNKFERIQKYAQRIYFTRICPIFI